MLISKRLKYCTMNLMDRRILFFNLKHFFSLQQQRWYDRRASRDRVELEPEALGHQDQVSPTWKKIGFHRDKVVLPNTLFVFRISFIQKCSISSVLSEISHSLEKYLLFTYCCCMVIGNVKWAWCQISC